MSEVRLVVRDARRDLSGNCHGSEADRVVAALAAEPETIEEMEAALERFCASDEYRLFEGFSNGFDDHPHDAGLVVVDLAARLVVCESTYSSPGERGEVRYRDADGSRDLSLPYHLSDDWQFLREALNWEGLAEKLRRQRQSQPRLDARVVLYGTALVESIARECWTAFAGRGLPAADGKRSDDPARDADDHLVRDVHARWLTTERADLCGQCPRDVLHVRRDHIDWDMQDRCEQWSMLGNCPPVLDRESAAYRFGGFGTHEIVVYYDLVRTMIWSCRDQMVTAGLAADCGATTAGDFLTTEAPRLAAVRDELLDTPSGEYYGRTPREIADHERVRQPEGMSGHEAMIDDDCPLCQMQADLPGPVFWHLDGCNMDDDFAFSIHCRTREAWDQEQRRHEEWDRRFREKEAERERLGVSFPGGGYADPDCVWERSFSAPDQPGESLYLRLFTIGSHLCELVVDLKQRDADEATLDALRRDFGNLREVTMGDQDPRAAEALFEPVVDRFCETLSGVAAAHSALAPKCSDLEAKLRRFLEPASEDDSSADLDDSLGDDLPF